MTALFQYVLVTCAEDEQVAVFHDMASNGWRLCQVAVVEPRSMGYSQKHAAIVTLYFERPVAGGNFSVTALTEHRGTFR